MTRLAGLSLALVSTVFAQQAPLPLLVNPDRHGPPLSPAFDLQSDGSPRFVWNTYQNHFERLYTTSFSSGRRARTQTLSA